MGNRRNGRAARQPDAHCLVVYVHWGERHDVLGLYEEVVTPQAVFFHGLHDPVAYQILTVVLHLKHTWKAVCARVFARVRERESARARVCVRERERGA